MGPRGRLLCVTILCLAMAGCSSPPEPPVGINYRSASLRYNGASYERFGVALAPFGSVSARVANTGSASMKAYGHGQSVRVWVDGVKSGSHKLKDCSCLTSIKIATGLDADAHVLNVINLAPRSLVVTGWTIDPGGSFRRTALTDTSVRVTLTVGRSVSFYVQRAASVAVDHSSGDATLLVTVDDRPKGYLIDVTGGSGGGSSPGGTASRTLIAWGLARGVTKLTITVATGELGLRGITLAQYPGLGTPRVVSSAFAERAPLLVVYGDSIGDGRSTLGFAQNSDGFAAQLTALRGWRLGDLSLDGASGACYGADNVAPVIARHPDAVIVEFGTNDMIPGKDFQGCESTPSKLEHATEAILADLQEALPTTPLFVQAILPTAQISDRVRATWNLALRAAATARAVRFVDPSPILDLRLDYSGPFHPNNRGHRKLAGLWNGVLPAL